MADYTDIETLKKLSIIDPELDAVSPLTCRSYILLTAKVPEAEPTACC